MFRLSVITMIGCLLFVLYGTKHFLTTKCISRHDKIGVALALLVVAFTVFMGLAGKKAERYILPVFPFLSVIGGYGIARFVSKTSRLSRYLLARNIGFWIAVCFVGVISTWQLVKLHPYPTAYFNPLVGGGKSAQRVLNIAWGEGIEEAAFYLNGKEKAKELVVGCDFHYLLDKYFEGMTVPLKVDEYKEGSFRELDYLVVTLDAMQKGTLRLHPEVLAYCSTQEPEYRIVFNGIPYVSIYRL
jgi:hypothetical protein